jgi:hypothetical protein
MTFASLSPTINDVIAMWSPPTYQHCSNCLHCVVGGEPKEPTVRCDAGQSESSRSLWQVIRERNPRGFRSAATCPGFVSMDDDKASEAAA